MMQVVEMSKDEQLAVYMRLSKRELAQMLVNKNLLLAAVLKCLDPPPSVISTADGTGTFKQTVWPTISVTI